MNIRTLLAALLLFGMLVACTQRTCPTYTKQEIKKTEVKDENS